MGKPSELRRQARGPKEPKAAKKPKPKPKPKPPIRYPYWEHIILIKPYLPKVEEPTFEEIIARTRHANPKVSQSNVN